MSASTARAVAKSPDGCSSERFPWRKCTHLASSLQLSSPHLHGPCCKSPMEGRFAFEDDPEPEGLMEIEW